MGFARKGQSMLKRRFLNWFFLSIFPFFLMFYCLGFLMATPSDGQIPGETKSKHPAKPMQNCDDGDPCTEDVWDETDGECIHLPVNCDDGDVCNGAESCDPSSGCVAGTPLSCDDSNVCTTDTCDPTEGCVSTEINCDDGDVCNGAESCDPSSGCVAGAPLSCDDGLFCNGAETCDPVGGCQGGIVFEGCADDGLFCNGEEHCDEVLDQCYSDNIPCSIDQVCREQDQMCLDGLVFSDGFESGGIADWNEAVFRLN